MLAQTQYFVMGFLGILNRSANLTAMWFLGGYLNLLLIVEKEDLELIMPNRLYWIIEGSLVVLGFLEGGGQICKVRGYTGIVGSRFFSGLASTQVVFSLFFQLKLRY